MKRIVMKILMISLLFCICLTPAFADLKSDHETMIRFFGDAQFLKGEHTTLTKMSISLDGKQSTFSDISVYTLEKAFCAYKANKQEQIYIVASLVKKEEQVQICIENKVRKEEKVYAAEYVVTLKESPHFAIEVELGAERDLKIDLQKLIDCVLQYAPKIYPLVKECLATMNLQCLLKLVTPLLDVYQCLFPPKSSIPDEISRQLVSRYLNWGLNRSQWCFYQEIDKLVEGLIVIDSALGTTYWSPNIIQGRVDHMLMGSNVVKVWCAVDFFGDNFAINGFIQFICKKL